MNIPKELRKVATLMQETKIARIKFSPEDQKEVDSMLKKYNLKGIEKDYKEIEDYMKDFFPIVDDLDLEGLDMVKRFHSKDHYGTFSKNNTKYDFKTELEEILDEVKWNIDKGNREQGFKELKNWADSREDDIKSLKKEIKQIKTYFSAVVANLGKLS